MRTLSALKLSALVVLTFGCSEGVTHHQKSRHEVTSANYFKPDCWGGINLEETPLSVPAVLAVKRRQTIAYVNVLSNNCDVNSLQIEEYDRLPFLLKMENNADIFVIEEWSEADMSQLAGQLDIEEVSTSPVHGPHFTSKLELYSVQLEVKRSTLRKPTQVSGFHIGQISDLSRLSHLAGVK